MDLFQHTEALATVFDSIKSLTQEDNPIHNKDKVQSVLFTVVP